MPVWIKFRDLDLDLNGEYGKWIASLQWYLFSSDEPKRFAERLAYAIKWFNSQSHDTIKMKTRTEIIPSLAFGVDVQNYGDTSDLIYMLDLDEVLERENQDETLITKHLGIGNYNIVKIDKEPYQQVVHLQLIEPNP